MDDKGRLYIKRCIFQGAPLYRIKSGLLNAGYDPEDIETELSKIHPDPIIDPADRPDGDVQDHVIFSPYSKAAHASSSAGKAKEKKERPKESVTYSALFLLIISAVLTVYMIDTYALDSAVNSALGININSIKGPDACFSQISLLKGILDSERLNLSKSPEKDAAECYANFSASIKDYSVCGKIYKLKDGGLNNAIRSRCYLKLSLLTGYDFCGKITAPSDSECYGNLAEYHLNASFCENIPAGAADYEACFIRSANKSNYNFACTRIRNGTNLGKCFAKIAMQSNNTLICDEVPRGYSYECYRILAKRLNSTKLCDLAGKYSWQCLQSINSAF